MLYQGYSQVLLDRELPIRFGLAPSLYFTQNPSQFDNKMAPSPAAFISYRLPKISLLARTGYRAINYTNLDTRSEVRASEIISQFGIKLHHPKLVGTNIIVAYTPSYVAAAKQLTLGKSVSVNPVNNFLEEYSNLLHHGVYAGIELDLSSRNGLEIGYSYSFNKKSTPFFVDGSPSSISLTYSINFNLQPRENSEKSKMKKILQELADKGTLYVINRTCESDFTNQELQLLWQEYYHFSKFKIVDDKDIPELIQSKGTFLFAVMGRYYSSLGDPETTGIYLLDKTATLLQRPYPYYIPINNGTSYCIGLKLNAAKGIAIFESELRGSSTYRQ